MTKKHEIVLVKSKPDSSIDQIIYLSGRVKPCLSFGNINDDFHNADDAKPQDLYVVSGEEVKVDDWGIGYATGFKGKGAKHFLFKHDDSKMAKLNAICAGNRKVIATTTELEVKEKRYLIPDEPFEYFELPKLPQDFIEKYIKEWNDGNVIKEVLLEYESNVLMEDGDDLSEMWQLKLNPDNTVIVHLVTEEKKYTRTEVKALFDKATYELSAMYSKEEKDKWFNKNCPE
ncbi:MAG TPA: hypothetical protein VN026_00150 [Bacteroidia bacterium]|jgi:hypothetical protein|nr:hypothetical protein [Bacteroidia bacterium]